MDYENNPLNELFQYARQEVTLKDIADFAPSDPGYPRYVAELSEIYNSGVIPKMADSEMIALTNHYEAKTESDPPRFRRFRIFTCSVGMMLLANERASDSVCPVNTLLIRLMEDSLALSDRHLLNLLSSAFDALHTALKECWWWEEEYPFCLLAIIITRLELGDELLSLRSLASQLIEEDQAVRKEIGADTDEFLLGLTNFDTYHHTWRKWICKYLPTETNLEEFVLIRKAIGTN